MVWSFIFWMPQLVLAAALAAALVWPTRFGRPRFTVAIPLASLFLVVYLYLDDVRRAWSLARLFWP